MVKKTKKIVNNKISNLFNKLDDFLDQDCAIKSLADTLDSINSKEIFDIYRYVFLNRDDNVSSEDLLSEDNPEFDCRLILKFGKNTNWASNNKNKILSLINNVLGNKVLILFDGDDSCEEFSLAETYLSYNRKSHFYGIQKK